MAFVVGATDGYAIANNTNPTPNRSSTNNNYQQRNNY